MPNTLTKAITENFDGRILAYTALGADAVADSYTTTTSMVNVDGHGYINFVAPPSGNVEIFASVYVDTTAARPLVFGLSDNLTYNAVDVTHEHIVYTGDETDEEVVSNNWIITGLTEGATIRYYLGVKTTATNSAYVLRWGGEASAEYPPLIMKATALPSTIQDGT